MASWQCGWQLVIGSYCGCTSRGYRANKFDGGVSDSGEGRWTVHAAVDLGVPTPVISTALFERFESRRLGAFAFKVLNGMRAMFGGHDVR